MNRNITNPDQFRANVCNKLKILLGHILEEDQEDTTPINMEKGIYNYAIKEANTKKIVKKWDNPHFVQLYIDKLRSMYINLKNPEILEHIKNGEILPQNVAFMTHQEYKPESWSDMLTKKMKRDESKFTNTIEASTDMFTCKKCKSKRSTYYELQTRSADEPSTIFITCLDCGKHWKN
jgi:transcription elongation factor S-II